MRTRSRLLLERALDRALRDPNPVARLRSERDEADDEEVARALAAVDPEGFRVAARLVAKLRFARIAAGSTVAGRLFREEPRRFVRLFVAFHAAFRPTTFPADEGRRFERFLRSRGVERSGRG